MLVSPQTQHDAMRILVIDDNPEDRAVVRHYLSEAGREEGLTIDTEEAEKGEDGLALYRSLKPDCILLDHYLPDMTGMEFLEHLQRDSGDMPAPVIILTGSAERGLADAALHAGAQDYMPKRHLGSERLLRAIQCSRNRFSLTAERRRSEIDLARREKILRLSQMAGGVAGYEHDIGAGVIRWAASSQTMLGFPPSMTTMPYVDWLVRLHPADAAGLALQHQAAIKVECVRTTCEVRLCRPDTGEMRHIEIRLAMERGTDGRASHAYAAVVDVTYQHDSRARLEQLAYLDPLTEIPNRRAFEAALATLCDLPDEHFAEILVDLDKFKAINDRLGHGAGDEVLAIVASRLRASIRDSDFVARLGGDEFAILLRDVKDWPIVETTCNRIIASLAQPVKVGSHMVDVGASAGVALFPLHADSADEISRCADKALYEAKRSGRGTWRWYQPDVVRIY